MAIDTSGIRKFRSWLNQYKATQGTPPPERMMTSFLGGEIEANVARQQAGRALSLRERQIDIGEEQFEKQFGEEQRRFGVQEQAVRRSERIAEKLAGKTAQSQRLSGMLNIGTTAANIAGSWEDIKGMGESAVGAYDWMTGAGKIADVGANVAELGTLGETDLWGGMEGIGITSWEGLGEGSDWAANLFSTWDWA